MKSQFMVSWIGFATVALIGGCGGDVPSSEDNPNVQRSEPRGIQFAQMIHSDIAVIREQLLDGGLVGGKQYCGTILGKLQQYEKYSEEEDKATHVAIIEALENLKIQFDTGDKALIEPQIDVVIALSEKLPFKPTLDYAGNPLSKEEKAATQ